MTKDNISADLLHRQCQRDTVIYAQGDRNTTFRELHDMSFRAASYLFDQGLVPSERVLFIMNDSAEWAAFFHGVVLVGAVSVIVNPKTDPDTMISIAKRVGATRIITESTLVDNFVGLNIPTIIVNDEYVNCSYYEFIWKFQEQDPLVMFFTSGSTGDPKIVVYAHGRMYSALDNYVAYEIAADSVVCCAPRMSFAFGWVVQIMVSLTFGSKHLLLSDMDIARIPAKVEQHGVSVLFVNPALMQILVRQQSKFGTHLLRIWCGSEMLSPFLAQGCLDKLNYYPGGNYGLTEVPGVCLVNHDRVDKLGALGLPAPGVMCRVIDDQGNDCVPNQTGQLLLKTNFTALEYFNTPEISAKSFQGKWLHTNDIVYQDEDGYYYFVSRSDHYVKIRGRLVSAVEIENIMTSYSGVTECSTSFGLNDGVMEAFSFLVVDDPLLDATTIRARMLTDGYSSHQIPKNIFVTKTLPKTPNGKRIRSLSRLLDQSL